MLSARATALLVATGLCLALSGVAEAAESNDPPSIEYQGFVVREMTNSAGGLTLLRRECDSLGCRDTDFTIIRMVIDYGPWFLAPQYGQLGVLTAYCEEIPRVVRCDPWVNDLGAERSGVQGAGYDSGGYRIIRWGDTTLTARGRS